MSKYTLRITRSIYIAVRGFDHINYSECVELAIYFFPFANNAYIKLHLQFNTSGAIYKFAANCVPSLHTIFHLSDFFQLSVTARPIFAEWIIFVCVHQLTHVLFVLVRWIKLAKITHSNYCIPTWRNFLGGTRISIGKSLCYHNKGRSLEIDVFDGVGPNVAVIRWNDVSDVEMKI